jgi:hypothetical protein
LSWQESDELALHGAELVITLETLHVHAETVGDRGGVASCADEGKDLE